MVERPQAHIHVLEVGDPRLPAALYPCQLDRNIQLDHNRIQKSFPTLLTEIDLDLLTVVGAVGFTDRVVQRRRSTGWSRDLHLSIPVSDPEFWTRREIQSALTECLAIVSGDMWEIKFTRLKTRRPLQASLRCDPEPFAEVSCVIPYSGGLDSLAGLQLWQTANPNEATLRIGTETNRGVGEVIRRSTAGWQKTNSVSVHLKFAALGDHPEATYRTRTFVFFSTAALAARLAGVSRVVIMENGQGTLGPSLVPMGDEWPYRSTHPLFTASLHRLLRLVWEGDAPVFEHPHMWATKTEVLRAAAKAPESVDAWRETRSCSRGPKRHKGAAAPSSCGLCGGCILRRSSLVAAGFGEIEHNEEFVWKNLSQSTLEGSGKFPVSDNDRSIAITNILGMRHLAEISTQPPTLSVLRVAGEAADACGIDHADAVGRIARLVGQHRIDWNIFLDHLGPKSWVTELGGVQQ